MVNPPVLAVTEADWNAVSPAIIEKEGKNGPVVHWYVGSKTLAERAAWDFVKDNKVAFDLTTVCPAYVSTTLFGSAIARTLNLKDRFMPIDFHL